MSASAFKGLKSILLRHTGSHRDDDVTVVLNYPQETCCHVFLEYEAAQSIEGGVSMILHKTDDGDCTLLVPT